MSKQPALSWSRCGAWICSLALCVLALFGCPKQVKHAFLPCQKAQGAPCMGGTWQRQATPPRANPWTQKPTYWRYKKGEHTVGAMLLGHPKDRMLAALGYAHFVSLLEIDSPKGVLAAGISYNINPLGQYAPSHYHRRLATWDRLLGYLQKANKINIQDIPIEPVSAMLTDLRTKARDFYQSSSIRKILYYHWPKQAPPLLVPYFTMEDNPQPMILRLSTQKIPTAQLNLFGRLFYQQKLREAMPLFKLLWNKYYVFNKSVEELLYPARLKCRYTWYKLFHFANQSIGLRQALISIKQINPQNPKQFRRLYCNKKRLEKFRLMPPVIRSLRLLREELIALDTAFRDYTSFHALAQKRLTKYKQLNISTALDGLLRQHTLYYPQHVLYKGKDTDPQDLFKAWQTRTYKLAWKAIHKTLEDDGKFMGTSKQNPAGYFDQVPTIYWSQEGGGGDELLIQPMALLSGDFAVVLDRTQGMLRFLTPHQPYPYLSKRSHPMKPQTSPQKTRSLRALIEQNSDKGVTLVHASNVTDIPEIPEIPARTFLLKKGFLWIRLAHTMTVIPILGANTLKPSVQKALVRQVETEMKRRDALPSMVKVIGIQGDTPTLQFRFLGDPKPQQKRASSSP